MTSNILTGAQRLSRRWLAFLVLAVLLHLLAIDWAAGVISLPAWKTAPVVSVQLLPEPAAMPAPAPAAPPPVKPKPAKAKARPRPAPVPVTPPQAEPEPAGTPVADAQPQAEEPAAIAEAAPVAAPPTEAAPAETPAGAEGSKTYTVQPPPSVQLVYTVNATRSAQAIHGSGKIAWHSNGGSYRVEGEAGVLFFNVLTFKSEGSLNSQGVAPIIYSEKRMRKSETNTHFHRERKTVSFSASTNTYPRTGSEQDRASIIWQLASIGRGDPSQVHPGAVFDIVVAGVRDEEPWQLSVVGQERIEVPGGEADAWHIVRRPRPGSYQQGLDIWLVPDHEWYPLKLRWTDPGGDYLEMVADSITRLEEN